MRNIEDKVREEVSDYYGKALQKTTDLKTNACCLTTCGISLQPNSVQKAKSLVADEVIESFYGCGSPIPPELLNCVVLDLG